MFQRLKETLRVLGEPSLLAGSSDRMIRIDVNVKATFTIHVPAPEEPVTLSPNGGALPDEVVGQPVSGKITIAGGKPPYKPSVSSGALPPGVSLAMDADGTDIDIEGTPTAPGDYTFEVSVDDSGS